MRAVLADNQNAVVLSVGALLALIATQLSAGLWWVGAAAALRGALAGYVGLPPGLIGVGARGALAERRRL